jgi:hypothetical protein
VGAVTGGGDKLCYRHRHVVPAPPWTTSLGIRGGDDSGGGGGGAWRWREAQPPGNAKKLPARAPPERAPRFGQMRRLSPDVPVGLGPSELNAAGGASVGPSCQCLQAKKKKEPVLRPGEAVGLAVPENFKSASFQSYQRLYNDRNRKGQKSARDAIECRLSISRFDLPVTRTPLPHASSVRGPTHPLCT